MFNPEEKKREQERKKREAEDKSKLAPLNGNHSRGGETVPISSLLDPDQAWLFYFQASENIRNIHGVRTVAGKWVIEDRAKFDKTVSELKKTLLRPVWKR